MRHALEVADWVEASASHFVGTFVGVTLAAILALIGATTVARWVWQHTREDVLFLAGWAKRRRWSWSTGLGPVPPRPMASVGPIEERPAGQSVRDAFGPVARFGPATLPKREPHHVEPPTGPAEVAGPDSTDLFAGPYTAGPGDDLETAVIAAASRLCRQAAAGGAP